MQRPMEVVYNWSRVRPEQLVQPPLPGLGRWGATLPPLAPAADLGAGGTPLVRARILDEFVGGHVEVWVKDESRNPTWSHKDRLNTVAVSAAVLSGAAGVVVASSGNHGASAAAHAAAAGLPCVLITSRGAPSRMADLMKAYGAIVVETETGNRWPLLEEVVRRYGFHPVSSTTPFPTGHPFGPEGYKTISYELFNQLGAAPDAVFVPTGYAELLFGIGKGFAELAKLSLCDIPRLYSCEPAGLAPLAAAFEQGARGAGHPRSNPGVVDRLHGEWLSRRTRSHEQRRRRAGAGHHDGERVVCVNTSSGMKTGPLAATPPHSFTGDWTQLDELLAGSQVQKGEEI